MNPLSYPASWDKEEGKGGPKRRKIMDFKEKDSILDKVLISKQNQELHQFSLVQLIFDLFANLREKEIQVLKRRFAFPPYQKKETLEEIGKFLEITRERVRQIEREGIKKIKQLEENNPGKKDLDKLENFFRYLLEDHGGVMSEEHLLEEILNFCPNNISNKLILLFIIYELFLDKFDIIKENNNFILGWKTKLASLAFVEEVLGELEQILKNKNELLGEDDLLNIFKTTDFYQKESSRLSNQAFQSYLRISQKIRKNVFGSWGLQEWPTITPHRMSDKIYLIFKHEGKPLHFTKIAELINKMNFDQKKAYPATIHNELILNKEQYILVGRGIYALGEWGYTRGTVSEVIADILRENIKPMSKEKIIAETMKRRLVQESTIYLALINKKKFKKLSSGGYELIK